MESAMVAPEEELVLPPVGSTTLLVPPVALPLWVVVPPVAMAPPRLAAPPVLAMAPPVEVSVEVLPPVSSLLGSAPRPPGDVEQPSAIKSEPISLSRRKRRDT